MKKIIYLIGIIGLFAFASCDDDQSYNENGVGREFTIGADTQFSGVESRAVFESGECTITNYVFLLYGHNEDVRKSTLLFMENYSSLPVKVILPKPNAGQTFHAIMIANTTKTVLEGQGITVGSQLEALFSATFDINTTDNNPTDATKFTWSGYLEVNPDTRQLDFILNPNLAKISVSVTDKSTDNDVINIQVRNVPNKARFAQNALSKAEFFTTADNATGITDWIDYDIEELTLTKNTAKSISWYLPHNETGTGNRSSNPVNAPQNATYVEVDGFRSVDFLDTAYKIYPGIDEDGVLSYANLKNFNVKADYQYKVTMSISDDGITYQTTGYNSSDHGGIEVDRVILPEGSNCYMIHPKFSNSAGGTVYELPAWQRVNEYWGNSWGVSGVGNSNNVITDDTEWEMYVIWQDMNVRALYFCDAEGNIVNTDGNKYSGKGKLPAYFKLDYSLITGTNIVTTLPEKDCYGNILVGVKKKGAADDGAWLWSWHLWLTDYIPDAAPEYTYWNQASTFSMYIDHNNGPQYTIDNQGYPIYGSATNPYTTPGTFGNVQHFRMYDENTYKYWSDSNSNEVWDNGGIYDSSWIMDRHIGAQCPSNADTKYPIIAFGMYYQFGRKDPFPMPNSAETSAFKLYKIDGTTEVKTSVADGGVSMNTSINNPTVYYNNNGARSWTSNYVNNPWYCPYSVSKGKKTLFDPCPPGWCLPVREAYHFASHNKSTSAGYGNPVYLLYDPSIVEYNSVWYQTTSEVWLDVTGTGLKTVKDYMRHFGIIRYHYTATGYQSDDCVDFYIPIQGYITPENGALTSPNTHQRGYFWTCDVDTKITGGFGFAIGIGNYAYEHILASDSSVGWLTRSGRTRHRYYYGGYLEQFGSAWGLNARCIQEPD